MEIYTSKYVTLQFPQSCYVDDPYIVKAVRTSNWNNDNLGNECWLKFMILGCEYVEMREWDRDGACYFDLSAYLRSAYTHTYHRLINGYSSAQGLEDHFLRPVDSAYEQASHKVVQKFVKLSLIDEVDVYSSGEDINASYLARIHLYRIGVYCIQGSNRERKMMTATRYHLYNPLYPHYYEFISPQHSILDYQKTIELFVDNDAPTKITKILATNDLIFSDAQVPLNSLRINDYIDESEYADISKHNYPDEGHTLTICNPDAFEPEQEWMNHHPSVPEDMNVGLMYYAVQPTKTSQYIMMDGAIAHLKDFTLPKKDVYLWDNRLRMDKMVCLRWIDKFGFMQQMCLDIASEDYSEDYGNDIVNFRGQDYSLTNLNSYADGYTNLNVMQATNVRQNKKMNHIYNITLVSVPELLIEDLQSLMDAKMVVWMKPNKDVDDLANPTELLRDKDFSYIQVSLKANILTKNARKHTVTFSATMTV